MIREFLKSRAVISIEDKRETDDFVDLANTATDLEYQPESRRERSVLDENKPLTPCLDLDPMRMSARPSGKQGPKENALTRALRSHQLWLTLTYFGLLVLIGRGLAG